jgi:hypothetical protein
MIDIPVADIRIGPCVRMRIFGDAEMTPPLVEIRCAFFDNIHLTVDQAKEIAVGLIKAAAKAAREAAP